MHEPVLVNEVIKYLHIESGKKYIDATVGAGGHSAEILKAGGEVLGLDQDKNMLEIAQKNLESLACPNFKLINTNFTKLTQIATENGFEKVSGILFDLGLSSLHYQWDDRGFSFNHPGAPLDMRLNRDSGLTAADLLNSLRQDQLQQIFPKKLALKIVEFRKNKPFEKVVDFLEVCKVLPIKSSKNPATVAFMTLRIAVNSEFENLKESLPQALGLLTRGGRLAVISFHSEEEAIVRDKFSEFERQNLAEILTKEGVKPGQEELLTNPRARSARLRVVEKL